MRASAPPWLPREPKRRPLQSRRPRQRLPRRRGPRMRCAPRCSGWCSKEGLVDGADPLFQPPPRRGARPLRPGARGSGRARRHPVDGPLRRTDAKDVLFDAGPLLGARGAESRAPAQAAPPAALPQLQGRHGKELGLHQLRVPPGGDGPSRAGDRSRLAGSREQVPGRLRRGSGEDAVRRDHQEIAAGDGDPEDGDARARRRSLEPDDEHHRSLADAARRARVPPAQRAQGGGGDVRLRGPGRAALVRASQPERADGGARPVRARAPRLPLLPRPQAALRDGPGAGGGPPARARSHLHRDQRLQRHVQDRQGGEGGAGEALPRFPAQAGDPAVHQVRAGVQRRHSDLRVRLGEQGRAGHPGRARRGPGPHRRAGAPQGGGERMKRGFEENVPKVRPRVRVGRALDEQVAQAREVAAAESAEATTLAAAADPKLAIAALAPAQPDAAVAGPLARAQAAVPEGETGAQALQGVRDPGRVAEPDGAREVPGAEPVPASPRRAARRPPGPSVSEVTDLVRALTTDLTKAADSNARLKADLEAALAALRAAADESRDQRAEAARLAADLESRASELRALRGDLDLLEAERDGALAQVARPSREGREEKARSAASAEEVQKSRSEAAQAREALQRLTAELRDRVAERDDARKEFLAARAERDRLAEELLAAHADAETAAQSRNALEGIHPALAQARARMSGIR